jgi:proteic killer suppression protein
MAIQSFGDRDTQALFETGGLSKRSPWRGIRKIALRKLDMIHYAVRLQDLRSPPGNKLEGLKGDWDGYYSIRINDQWRIVFRWGPNGPAKVKIVDYH